MVCYIRCRFRFWGADFGCRDRDYLDLGRYTVTMPFLFIDLQIKILDDRLRDCIRKIDENHN